MNATSRPTRALGSLLLLALMLAPPTALAGDLDGEAGLDVFMASSTSDEPASGTPERLTSAELGLRLRSHLTEADGRLTVDLDYRGRQALTTGLKNQSLHLLYALDLRYEVVAKRWGVGVGRFLAPSVTFLPVDGVHTDLKLGAGFEVTAFGGRRGITTSRRQLPLGDFLPAFGGSVRKSSPAYSVELLGAWAQDEAVVAGASEVYGAANVAARGWGRVSDQVTAGGQLAFVQRATYVVGPRWRDVTVDVDTLGLFSGLAWVDVAPGEISRVEYDLQFQRASAYRTGTDFGTAVDDLQSPNFFDNRLRLGLNPGKRGWLRAEGRLRVRPDRYEWRYGLRADLTDLQVPGLYAGAQFFLDSLTRSDDPAHAPAIDRLSWSARVGYHRDGLDVQLGASAIERADNPVSSRMADPAQPLQPERSDDLAPFVQGAENIAFLRGFYSGRRWFAGLDYEQSLNDAEFRLMLQTGLLWGASW